MICVSWTIHTYLSSAACDVHRIIRHFPAAPLFAACSKSKHSSSCPHHGRFGRIFATLSGDLPPHNFRHHLLATTLRAAMIPPKQQPPDPAMAAPSAHPLFRLPRELRLEIYDYFLPSFSSAEPLYVPQILHICHFIRKEVHDFWVGLLRAAVAKARAVHRAASVEYDRAVRGERADVRVLVGMYRRIVELEERVRVLERLGWCLGVEV